MGLFGPSKRKSTYQGFQRYSTEPYEYQSPNVAGIPNNGITRSASMTNGAGSAALAALRLHQHSEPVDTLPNRSSAHRTNSLTTSSGQRSNSLRSYSYHPKGSYTPGNGSDRRHSSLVGNNNFQNQLSSPKLPSNRNKRYSSLSSQNTSPKRTVYEENSEEEQDMVVTTQTTKVVDSQGRVQSITTKTIKTLPDGSNIIETTTKNISRSNSRTNSLRTNSLANNPQRDPNYNLQKIEEDLQDFEYNYVLDNNLHHEESNIPQQNYLNEHRSEKELDSDLTHNAESLKLNTNDQPSTRSASLSSSQVQASPIKPLKSILKNSRPDAAEKTDENSEFDTNQIKNIDSPKAHPYKAMTEQPKFKVPEKPKAPRSPSLNSPLSPTLRGPQTSPGVRHNGKLSPRNDEIGSSRSITSSTSIRFDEKVETIPIYETDFKSPKEQQQLSNQELYNKAMQVAMQKVYGNSNASPPSSNEVLSSPPQAPVPEIPRTAIKSKNKRDKIIEESNGLDGNYQYGNHHKEFAVHSLRESNGSVKRQLTKEDKLYQKELAKQEKLAKKQKKLEEKSQGKSPKRNFFGRKKKDSFDTATLNSDVGSSIQMSPITAESKQRSEPESPIMSRVTAPPPEERVSQGEYIDDTIVPEIEHVRGERTSTDAPAVASQIEPVAKNNLVLEELEAPGLGIHDVSGDVPKGNFVAPVAVITEPTPVTEYPPVLEPIPEPVTEPVPEPVTEPVPEPVTEPISEPTTESTPLKKKPSKVGSSPVFLTHKSEISPPQVSTPEIGKNVDAVTEPEEPEIKTQNAVAGVPIPTPVLHDITSDNENMEDSGLVSEYEDGDENGQSVRSRPLDIGEQFYEADANGFNDEVAEDEDEGNETVVESPENKTKITTMEQTLSVGPVEQSNQPKRSIENVDIDKKYTLADLINMGRAEDNTEDSLVPPDTFNDSDSDVSSRFSADLNAALKRITDDKEVHHDVDEPASNEDRHHEPTATGQSDVVVETNNQKGKKSKKKSSFKTKILKYFVNNYER